MKTGIIVNAVLGFVALSFIAVLLITSKSPIKSTYQRERDAAQTLLETATTPSCFHYTYLVPAEHEWEKDHVFIGASWMLVSRDKEGILVAQPIPDLCSGNTLMRGDHCKYYWIRTVDFKDFWITGKIQATQCPEHLTTQFINKTILEQYAEEFKTR